MPRHQGPWWPRQQTSCICASNEIFGGRQLMSRALHSSGRHSSQTPSGVAQAAGWRRGAVWQARTAQRPQRSAAQLTVPGP